MFQYKWPTDVLVWINVHIITLFCGDRDHQQKVKKISPT